ncbi:MAG: hypothetical protein GQE15_11555 [Archangiaceae bacterium]|nr:hypothetical protein [Archangiaceae bacterium]
MSFDLKLVQKGKEVPLTGLLDQANVSAPLASTHAALLGRYGFTAAHVAQFAPAIADLGTDRARATEARTTAAQNTATEREALSAVKKFKTLLLSAADDLAIEGQMRTTDREALNAGEELGRSTAKHSAYLTRIRKVVENHKAALAPYLDGADALVQLDTVKRELDTAQAVQEVDVINLSDETKKVYEQKGRLLSLIEKLNRAAARAFHGDAAMKAKFNKDLILRAVQSRKKTGQPAT